MKYTFLFFFGLITLNSFSQEAAGTPKNTSSTTQKESKKARPQAAKFSTDTKVLYLLDGRVITKKESEQLNPDQIDHVDIWKTKEKIAAFTAEKVDGVVVIYMKKLDYQKELVPSKKRG